MAAKFVTIAKTITLLAAAFFLVAAGLCLVTLSQSYHQTSLHLNKALDHISTTADALGTSATTLSQDVHSQTAGVKQLVGRASLAVKQAQYLILKLGLTSDAMHKAADKEVATLDTLNTSLIKTMDDVNSTVLTTQKTVANLNPVFLHTSDLLQQAQTVLSTTNTILANKSIPETLANAQTGTKAISDMAQDSQQAWHTYLHPTWPMKIAHAITGVGIGTVKFFW